MKCKLKKNIFTAKQWSPEKKIPRVIPMSQCSGIKRESGGSRLVDCGHWYRTSDPWPRCSKCGFDRPIRSKRKVVCGKMKVKGQRDVWVESGDWIVIGESCPLDQKQFDKRYEKIKDKLK